MKLLLRLTAISLLGLCVLTPPGGVYAREPRTTRVREQFAFEIRDLKVSHQGGNVLSLNVHYDYRPGMRAADYPDFRKLAHTCEEFFLSYPNSTDYWEILNLKLTAKLLRDFPALTGITIEIRVAPNESDPYARSSTVTRSR